MNRVFRDYCNRGRHPNWRAWKAKYEQDKGAPYGLRWAGNFCVFCGERVHSAQGSESPKRQQAARRAVFRGEG
jgi:hypothetical protein